MDKRRDFFVSSCARLLRAVALETSRAIGKRRWVFVIIAFFVLGWLEAGNVVSSSLGKPLDSNVWDLPLSLASDQVVILFFFALGFIMVTGDGYVEDLAAETAAPTLLRSRSRTLWWMAKILSLGPLALLYASLALATLFVAAAFTLPVEFAPSSVANIPWSAPEALYPRLESVPMPAFFALVVLYTSCILWAVGAVVLTISVFVPKLLAPLVIGLIWIVGISWLLDPLRTATGLAILDPTVHLSYVVHFGTSRFEAIPWWTSLLVAAIYVMLSILIGSIRLRRTDL